MSHLKLVYSQTKIQISITFISQFDRRISHDDNWNLGLIFTESTPKTINLRNR